MNPNKPLSTRELREAGIIPSTKRTRREAARTHRPKAHERTSPTNNGSFRQSVAISAVTLYGDDQNGYVTGIASLNRPPKGDPGCTVKLLDYRTPASPERK